MVDWVEREVDLGMAWGTPAAPMFLSPGGVTARPTWATLSPHRLT